MISNAAFKNCKRRSLTNRSRAKPNVNSNYWVSTKRKMNIKLLSVFGICILHLVLCRTLNGDSTDKESDAAKNYQALNMRSASVDLRSSVMKRLDDLEEKIDEISRENKLGK